LWLQHVSIFVPTQSFSACVVHFMGLFGYYV
jgi:hypothetical protein